MFFKALFLVLLIFFINCGDNTTEGQNCEENKIYNSYAKTCVIPQCEDGDDIPTENKYCIEGCWITENENYFFLNCLKDD